MNLRATVLMPAHNEASVIACALRPLRDLVETGTISLIVIANGCSDDTAVVAAALCPMAEVLQTQTAGKTQALNLGIERAHPGLPVLCLDADLELTAKATLALVLAVETGALAAVGQMQVDSTLASRVVQAYQRAWTRNPYFANGKFGGVFALAPKVALSLFPLPEVTGDDEYLRRSIDANGIVFVPECQFTAQSPRTLASLFATRKRALRGARQVQRLGLANPTSNSSMTMLKASLSHPGHLIDLAVFAAIGLAARLALALESQSKAAVWERDLTTRKAGVAP